MTPHLFDINWETHWTMVVTEVRLNARRWPLPPTSYDIRNKATDITKSVRDETTKHENEATRRQASKKLHM